MSQSCRFEFDFRCRCLWNIWISIADAIEIGWWLCYLQPCKGKVYNLGLNLSDFELLANSAWYLNSPTVVSFCKKGDDHYTDISLRSGVPRLLTGLCDVLLSVYYLYIIVTRYFIRIIDLSRKQGGFKDITNTTSITSNPSGWRSPFSILQLQVLERY
ncbi:unnamed protein product [Cochlearia groenlandica]